MTTGDLIWAVILYGSVLLLGLAVLLIGYMLWRIRHINAMGAFICSYRPSLSAGWLEGYAVYGTDYLSWYKAGAFSLRPTRHWVRRHMELERGRKYLGKAGKVNVAVPVKDGHYNFWLFMDEDDYSGLVSWVEAAPPVPLDQSDQAL